ncbi:MAG: ferredoxin, partial [Gammaproteobacteria bacterium]|nr:ferredoxin [Gammaproteobacteria bacterium]
LLELAGAEGSGGLDLAEGDAASPAPGSPSQDAEAATASGYSAPWLETEACTACDECTNLNPSIFAYNEDGKAFIKDPAGGPYSDLVKAAERCTARVIHPGLPRSQDADQDKWIARGSKFN